MKVSSLVSLELSKHWSHFQSYIRSLWILIFIGLIAPLGQEVVHPVSKVENSKQQRKQKSWDHINPFGSSWEFREKWFWSAASKHSSSRQVHITRSLNGSLWDLVTIGVVRVTKLIGRLWSCWYAGSCFGGPILKYDILDILEYVILIILKLNIMQFLDWTICKRIFLDF